MNEWINEWMNEWVDEWKIERKDENTLLPKQNKTFFQNRTNTPLSPCSKDVLELFDRYVENNVRHLNKPEAVQMLMSEFGLEEGQAEVMFETFDKDHNGIMSIWEFEQFYMCMGNQWVLPGKVYTL